MSLAEILTKKKPLAAGLNINNFQTKTLRKALLGLEKTGIDFLTLYFQNVYSLAYKNELNGELKKKLELAEVFTVLKTSLPKRKLPLVLALNTADILRYGIKQFYAEAKACGLEAILVLDLPPEEGSDFIFLSRQQRLNMIFSAADNTLSARLEAISAVALPFIRLMVNQKFLISKKEHYFAQLKAVTDALKNISTKSIILETEELPRESLQRIFNHTDGIIFKDPILSGPNFSLRQAEKKINKIIKEIDNK